MKTRMIGITGQTGAGKSEVSSMLRGMGYPVIDADEVAHEVTAPGSECLRQVAEAFGSEMLREDGSLDRRQLGTVVFRSKEKLRKLEAITYPCILERVQQLADGYAGTAPLVFLDAPTLFESGADRSCECVIAVTAKPTVRLARIMARDGLTEQQARDRMRSQHDEVWYTSRSRYVIDNSFGLTELHWQVTRLLHELLRPIQY